MTHKELEADIVIAGGGASGCVIAARLAAARPDWDIVLVEQGVDTRKTDEYDIPLLSLGQVWQKANTLKVHKSPASDFLDGRESSTPAANLLGGGTLVNMMIFNTPAASDFDDWAQPGWSFDELLPYTKKITTAHVEDPGSVYGTDGPMQISHGGYRGAFVDEFNVVMAKAGYRYHQQLFDYRTGTGCTSTLIPEISPDRILDSRFVKWISSDGKRQHAARAYLCPDGENLFSNLEVLVEMTVDRVEFENGRAVEVRAYHTGKEDSILSIRARKQIILCSGALSTPAILQRSGIGPKELLTDLEIPLVADLPGVGKEYLDHTLAVVPFHAPDDAETVDDILEEDPAAIEKAMKQYKETRDGPLADMPATGALVINPTDRELSEIGPKFTQHWRGVGADKPDKKLLTVYEHHNLVGDRFGIPPGGRYFLHAWQYNYPASRGHLRIRSKDPRAPLDFDDGLLSHPADMEALIWTYKKLRHLGRQYKSFRGEVALQHPEFPEGSDAAVKRHEGPTDVEIRYSEKDDEAIATWVRKTIGTSWHSMGTCPMKPRERGGVVDARLDVYGVSGLKVAGDMSIPPANIGANTALTAMTIGEKAAALILEDLS